MAVDLEKDREFLTWVFSQFLYGEVTGIQCGHWLMRAPTLEAASFIARQSVEELSHVKRMRKIIGLLGKPEGHGEPVSAHPIIKFLSTGMMSNDWAHHVAIEMAMGEGLVLEIFHILEAEIPHSEIKLLIQSAIPEETRHAEFGTRETQQWLRRFPSDRRRLRTQLLVQWVAMNLLARWLKRSAQRRGIRAELKALIEQSTVRVFGVFERQLRAMELFSEKPTWASVVGPLIVGLVCAPWDKFRMRWHRPKSLTSTYLKDPWVLQR